MKIRKTVSEKVIAANRLNAQQSPGPGDCTDVRHNAVKHGFRSNHLLFNDAEEEKQYQALLEELEEYYEPEGPIELMLIGEIAGCFWKLKMLDAWELEEIVNRRKAAKAILCAVAENNNDEHLSFLAGSNGSGSAAQSGWECQQLLVRTGSRNSEKQEGMSTTDKIGQVQIEARLNTSIDLILRYRTALKRDYYRAIQTLRDMQQQRRAE